MHSCNSFFFLQTLRKLKIINMFFFTKRLTLFTKQHATWPLSSLICFLAYKWEKNTIKADDIFISSRKRSIYRLNSGCQNFNRWTVTNLIKGAVPDSDLDLHNLSRYITASIFVLLIKWPSIRPSYISMICSDDKQWIKWTSAYEWIIQLLMIRWDLFRISSKHIRYIYSYKHLKSAPVQQICDTYVPYRIFFVVLLPPPGQVFFNTQPKLYNSIDNFAGHKLTKQHAFRVSVFYVSDGEK